MAKRHPSSPLPKLTPLTLSVGLFVALAVASAFFKHAPEKLILLPSVVTPTTTPAPTSLPYPIPVLIHTGSPPWLNARGVLVTDVPSGISLYEKNADAQLQPASTTKMLTALVATAQFGLADAVTITNANESIGSKAQLMPGEVFSVEDLLYALLLDSGNDAAVTLAQHLPDGYTAFIQAMNNQAKALGLQNTHFTNASGIDSPYHYSSARDLSKIALKLMDQPLLKTIVGTHYKSITDKRFHQTLALANTNQLLGVLPGVEGIKTGSTPQAGECLVTYINRNHHPIIMVLLGSSDRFGETTVLTEWIYQNFSWEATVSGLPVH